MKHFDRKFFEKNTLEVAKDLIGKLLVFGDKKCVITETEAYFGDDSASHGYCGKTERNFSMFGPAGFSYVYFVYGMYHCFNIATEKEDYPAAVLIRGIKTLDDPAEEFNGPGKLCNYLGITREHNNLDLCNKSDIYVADIGLNFKARSDKRVGIKKNIEKKWRFVAYKA